MQNIDFCLRMQSLDNDSNEIYWNGIEFIDSNGKEASLSLKKNDFVYEHGVACYSDDNIEIKFHYSGWLLLTIAPIERDVSGRLSPLSIMINLKELNKGDFDEYMRAIPSSLGRSFSLKTLKRALHKVNRLIRKGTVYIFVYFFYLKFFGKFHRV